MKNALSISGRVRAIVAGAIALQLGAATPALAGTITIKGSDTMVILVQRWAEAFMKAQPGTTIQVTGGGSGTGISALINGTTDVCMSSRAMKAQEKEKVRERHGSSGQEIPVARDGLSLYVHASSPIDELTLDQLKQIYSGKINNWKDVGGPDAKIIPYSRENSSGTYAYFREEVLANGDFSPRVQGLPGTAAVVNAVSKEQWGIGYGGAAYAKGVKILKLKSDAASPGIPPTADTMKDGTYPLSRPLFFYFKAQPAGETKAFVDFVLGPEGQAIVEKVGYYTFSKPSEKS